MTPRRLNQYAAGFRTREWVAPDPHMFGRPDWLCTTCGDPWPCAPARDRLLAETNSGTCLAMACWTYLEEYVHDSPDGKIDGLFDRFIGWSRRQGGA